MNEYNEDDPREFEEQLSTQWKVYTEELASRHMRHPSWISQ